MRMLKTTTIVLLFALPSLCCAGAREDLQGVKKAIRQKSQLLTQTRKVESKVSGELVQMQRSLLQKQAALAALGRDLAVVEQGIGKARVDMEKKRAESEVKRAQIDRRVAAIYKSGGVDPLRAFFSSESFPQLAENQRYLSGVLDSDKRLFTQYSADLAQLKAMKAGLEREAARKETIRVAIEAKKREIELEKGRKSSYLVKVRQDKQGYLASIKELQANAARLQGVIARLEARSRKTRRVPSGEAGHPRQPSAVALPNVGLGAARGKLALPVQGTVVERFGRHKNSQFDSYTVSNGLSIAASQGAPIRAIYGGEVIFAEHFKGYGNMIIVDHGDGFFSLYAHASSLAKKVGSKVAKQEVLAYVGDNDSARGPMLYFEIRFQGRPVDPSAWFR